VGSHGDVGGNGDAALGAVTLLWMIGKLHNRVGVLFIEAEIARHLKHKYLEWDFAVNKAFRSFKEKKILSTMPHSGRTP
jgi:hemolysin-activating ACP:hemolysin acyltransferase